MNKNLAILAVLALALTAVSCGKKVGQSSESLPRREAKRLAGEGWMVTPGSVPMEVSLERSWRMQEEMDEDGEKKYLYADGNGVGETQTAAELQAIETAKLELAGQLQTEIASIVETSVANRQIDRDEAASMTKVVQGAKNVIATSIGRVDPVYKIYREVGASNIEVQVMLFMSKDAAMQKAKQTVRDQLEEETDIIHDKLDQVLGL